MPPHDRRPFPVDAPAPRPDDDGRQFVRLIPRSKQFQSLGRSMHHGHGICRPPRRGTSEDSLLRWATAAVEHRHVAVGVVKPPTARNVRVPRHHGPRRQAKAVPRGNRSGRARAILRILQLPSHDRHAARRAPNHFARDVRRRSSSKKFNRNVTCTEALASSAVADGTSASILVPSGARSKF
jgi:hypothetical protein